MIWVNATNLVNQAPDCHETLRAFAATEFKVVVDAFLNDTAARADLILPPALTLEREDLAGGVLHNFVNYAARAVEPPGEARTDHWIVSELGKRLDPPVLVPTVEEILRASLDSPYVDVSLDELRRPGYAPVKRPAIAYADRRFPHPDGKYHFPARLHDETPPPPGYPFRLLTLVRREVIHSQILPEDHEPFPTVWVAPDSVALHGLDLARDVDLVSPLGRLKVEVKTLPGLYPEAVLCRRGGWLSRSNGFNQLVADGTTDLGGGTAFYHQYVRLENG